ncbi:hypothetical protein TNCT_594431, partial [Trichonephila clavata]
MTPARAANDAEQKSGHPLTLRPLAADDTFSPSTLGSSAQIDKKRENRLLCYVPIDGVVSIGQG